MNFRKMAINEHVDLRKTENFVRRRKCYAEDIRKIKERKLVSENLKRTLKWLMGI